jgi:hypothetical protein
MNRKYLIFFGALILISLAGCTAGSSSAALPQTGGTRPSQATPLGTSVATNGPTRPATTAPATAAPQPSPTMPGATTQPSEPPVTSGLSPDLTARLTNTCGLLNSNDLASILVTGELETENVPATEVNCVYYEFHNPGKKDQELLQVTYWLDLPGQGVSGAAWRKVWTDATQKGQQVSGIGDQAFVSSDGELSFKQGSLYFTLEIVDTSRSAQQNVQISHRLAADMLKNLASMQNSGG